MSNANKANIAMIKCSVQDYCPKLRKRNCAIESYVYGSIRNKNGEYERRKNDDL